MYVAYNEHRHNPRLNTGMVPRLNIDMIHRLNIGMIPRLKYRYDT